MKGARARAGRRRLSPSQSQTRCPQRATATLVNEPHRSARGHGPCMSISSRQRRPGAEHGLMGERESGSEEDEPSELEDIEERERTITGSTRLQIASRARHAPH